MWTDLLWKGECISFLCCVTNYQKFSGLAQCTFIVIQFCSSKVQSWLSWILCSGYHEAEIKVSAGLGCHLKHGALFQAYIAFGRI